MNAAPNLRYTDRDVRENPEFIPLVHNYLKSYEGEFQYLVDCKMALMHHGALPTALMRGVLNCMRNDARIVGQLPTPLPIQLEAEVIPMKRKAKWTKLKYLDCDITEPHPAHPREQVSADVVRNYCHGIYEINRISFYRLPAKVNDKYTAVVGKTGLLVHKLTGEAEVGWMPYAHQWGFLEGYGMNGSFVDVFYKTHCKGASIIKNGVLLTSLDAEMILRNRTILDLHLAELGQMPTASARVKPLSWCKKCWAES